MKIISDRKKALLRQFHTICTVNGIHPYQKEAILGNYGVESSRDLTEGQLKEIINNLNNEANKWRKRVIAAIGAWLRMLNKNESIDIIKPIACRASGHNNFNRIPVSRLRDIYYEFSKKAKTAKNTRYVIADIEHELSNLN